MEPSAGIVIALTVLAAALAVGFLLANRGRRDDEQATAPPAAPSPARFFATPDQRESQALADWLLVRAREQTGVDVGADAMAFQRIAEAAQKAREELRSRNAVSVSLPFLTADATGPKHFEIQVTRETLHAAARAAGR